MKVAAYQAPLQTTSSPQILDLIREQILLCESNGVEILCCPEAVIGGLADYAQSPPDIAINIESGQLQSALAPLASDRVTTILGFTEIASNNRLYNSAAVLHKGSMTGIYRKIHPAINKSVYGAGCETPVFTVGDLTFGIVICNDSNFPELARVMSSKGAKALFIPTNNGLLPQKAGPEIVERTRLVDISLATANHIYVIRADVAGRHEQLVGYGSSGIVDPDGNAVQTAQQLESGLIVADIPIMAAPTSEERV